MYLKRIFNSNKKNFIIFFLINKEYFFFYLTHSQPILLQYLLLYFCSLLFNDVEQGIETILFESSEATPFKIDLYFLYGF